MFAVSTECDVRGTETSGIMVSNFYFAYILLSSLSACPKTPASL